MIKAEINNCNNIISANIQLKKNCLNIRYAMNGTGKSTIAKSIEFSSKDGDLHTLQPFDSEEKPTCVLTPSVKTIALFDEEFVNTIVFQKSDVIKNAFDVFIKTPEYEQQLNLINNRLTNLRLEVDQNPDLLNISTIGRSVLSKLTATSGGQLRKNPFFKSLTESDKIFKLQPELSKFQPFVNKEYVVDWVDWKQQGGSFDDNLVDDRRICPFCTISMSKEYDKEKQIFTSSYSKSNIKNVKEMLSYFESIKEFMDQDSYSKLNQLVKETKDGPEITAWLNRFWSDLHLLVTKIENVENFNSYKVRSQDISHLEEQLNSLLIDFSDLKIFINDKVKCIVEFINNKISLLLKETEQLKIELGKLNAIINTTRKTSISDINDFLRTAGISYELDIKEESENQSRAILKYIPRDKEPVEVADIKPHLSWGERNAFALVLFMYDALRKKPDIIVLDDPISSFDSHKKYAIINRLFSPKLNSLYKKTVLMLTHDMQPLIDILVNNLPIRDFVSAYFLQNKKGVIYEQVIEEDDMKPLPTLLTENANNEALNIFHRMACIRKLLEINPKDNDQTINAYHLLSSIFHIRKEPTLKDNITKLNTNEIKSGEEFIRLYIKDFRYADYANKVLDNKYLLECFTTEKNNYIRLQIFRILIKAFDVKNKISDNTLEKYIDEQLHIENDYLFSLDLIKYDLIPDFVIPMCDDFIQKECKVS